MQNENKIWFRTLCRRNGFAITDVQLDQLDHYVHLLLDWNKKINLISRKDEENFWTYHILHCISPLFKLKFIEGCKIVDIGTGGGLPGIPLKILRPDSSMLCLDATRKKANAVSQMVEELKLENINVVWGRAEEIGMQSEHFHRFDFTIARAVCQLNELIALSLNFLKKRDSADARKTIVGDDGRDPNPPVLLAFKGGDLTQEISAAQRQYPKGRIYSMDLSFPGSEQLIASDKKLLIVHG